MYSFCMCIHSCGTPFAPMAWARRLLLRPLPRPRDRQLTHNLWMGRLLRARIIALTFEPCSHGRRGHQSKTRTLSPRNLGRCGLSACPLFILYGGTIPPLLSSSPAETHPPQALGTPYLRKSTTKIMQNLPSSKFFCNKILKKFNLLLVFRQFCLLRLSFIEFSPFCTAAELLSRFPEPFCTSAGPFPQSD